MIAQRMSGPDSFHSLPSAKLEMAIKIPLSVAPVTDVLESKWQVLLSLMPVTVLQWLQISRSIILELLSCSLAILCPAYWISP